ncbi:MAG TPA: Na+/H+ antiporter NhaA [Vicinamibacterales bacterium]|nr:Na+/H+ antiporter NhaA [Vicinamibacterales bacterium]
MTAAHAHGDRTGPWAFIIDNSLLLVFGTVTALVWANLAPHSYDTLAHGPLHFIVNDIGMVFFFALAAKEIIEATLPGGPLASPREAAVPLLAAAGGMIAPASLYAVLVLAVGRPELSSGWAVPCATDIAFSYMAARLIFPRDHPAIPFLLLLAIADDAMGLMLLAVFYPSGPLSLLNFTVLMIPAIGVSVWLKRRRTLSYWPYVLVGGGLSWAALYLGGVHPALAMVPILPFMPHEKRDLGLFHTLESHLPYTMNRFEHAFKVPVQIILLFFGLVNAGVPFGSVGSGTWIVFIALIAGKPLGIVAMTFLGVKLGLRAPGGLTYGHTLVVGLTAGIGFTVALFFATAAFRGPELLAVLDEAKMGALFSFLAAPAAILLGRSMGLRPKPQLPKQPLP